MIRPIASIDDLRAPRGSVFPIRLFFLIEAALVLLVPIIGYLGSQALLDTRAGSFVVQPTPTDPGWLATVEASPVTGVVEVLGGKVTGVSIVTQQTATAPGGAVLFVWPSMLIDGVAVGDMAVEEVVPAIAGELRLGITKIEILDEERWALVLGEETRPVDNPDPIGDLSAEPLLPVGLLEIGADRAALFIGQPVAGENPEGVIIRRSLWWRTLLEHPPIGDDDLAALMRALGAGPFDLVNLPMSELGGEMGSSANLAASEEVIVGYVAFPTGSRVGDRLQVRLLTRASDLDHAKIARSLTRQGYEVVQIGNAEVFDDGPAQVLVPGGMSDDRINQLAELYGAATVYPTETNELDEIVTLVVGTSAAEMSSP